MPRSRRYRTLVALPWLALGVWLASLVSCTATCLRDSDCMGASICTENRCILIVGSRRDGGRTPGTSSDTDNTGSDTSDAGSELEPDAGVN